MVTFQVFNANVDQIKSTLASFGELLVIEPEKHLTYKSFLDFLGEINLDFAFEYNNTPFLFTKTPVGYVLKMPNINISDTTKVVILRESNITVGLKAHKGFIFLVDVAYTITLNLNPVYHNLNQDKLIFELSKALSQEVNGYLPLADFPTNEILKKEEFEKMYGVKLETRHTNTFGKEYFVTRQGPIYVAENFYKKVGDLYVCRPNGADIYLTRMTAGIKR
jgi:hypothetical protein